MLIANMENSHHLAERGPKIFNTESESQSAEISPSIAFRDAEDSSIRNDRVPSASGVNLSAIRISWLRILRDIWTRHEISQNTCSFLPAIDRSFDSIRPEARTQAARRSERSSPREIRKESEKKGIFLRTFLSRPLNIRVVRDLRETVAQNTRTYILGARLFCIFPVR